MKSNRIFHSWGKRVAFFVLAAWLHCAALFYIAFVLFKGADKLALEPTSQPGSHTISVSLHADTPPIAPEPLPTPSPDTIEPPADDHKENTITAPSEEKTPPASEKSGILSCNALTKRPERIIYGPDDVQFTPDGNAPGYAILRTTIDHKGTVVDVVVEESTMESKLEGQTVAWAYRKSYQPGEIDGVAVDCVLRYMVSTQTR